MSAPFRHKDAPGFWDWEEARGIQTPPQNFPVLIAVGASLASSAGAIIAAGGLAASGLTIGGILASAAVSALLAGAQLLLSASQKPKAASPQEIPRMIREPISNRQLVYGRCRPDSKVMFVDVTNDKKDLHLVLAVAGHEIDAFEEVYFGETLVWTAGGGYQEIEGTRETKTTYTYTGQGEDRQRVASGSATTFDTWEEYARINFHTGTDDQTADADLISESETWTSAHRLRGVAYMYVRLKHDATQFQGGIPTIIATVRGKKIFDPRDGTTRWTANAALVQRDYLTDQRIGLRAIPEEIDDASFIAAANLADERVVVENATEQDLSTGMAQSTGAGDNVVYTQARYEVNGWVDTGTTPREILESLLTSNASNISYSGGRFRISGGAYRPSSHSFDASALRSGMRVATRVSIDQGYNAVRGTFRPANSNYVPDDFPAAISGLYATVDGEPRYRDLELGYETSVERAQRLAKLALLQSRSQQVVVLPFKLHALGVAIGETISFSHPRYAWVNREFEVLNWGFSVDSEGRLGINVTAKETGPEIWNWLSSEEQEYTPSGRWLPSAFVIARPTNVSAAMVARVQRDGSVVPTLTVDFTPSPESDMTEVQWSKDNFATYDTGITPNSAFEFAPIDETENYDVRVRATTRGGNPSLWVRANFVDGTGDNTPPPVPASLIHTAGVGSIAWRWADNPAPDYARTVVRRGLPGSTIAQSTEIGRVGGTLYTDSGLIPGSTHRYWFAAEDTSGNVSNYAGPFTGTALQVQAVDIAGELIGAQIAADAISSSHLSSGSVLLGALATEVRDEIDAAFQSAAADVVLAQSAAAAAEAARDQSQAAQAAATAARNAAQAARDTAQDAEGVATAASNSAAASAADAGSSASAADAHRVAAQNAENAADVSANASAASASASLAHRDSASASASAAQTDRIAAQAARDDADNSASASAASATTAGTHSTNAGASASAADNSRIAAEAAESNSAASAASASTSSSQAAASATAAGQSATTSSNAANTATTKAGEASASSASAATSASTATGAANSATASATLAASTAEEIEGRLSLANFTEPSSWTTASFSGEAPVPNPPTGMSKTADGLQSTNYASWTWLREYIPVDTTRKYRASMTAEQLVASTSATTYGGQRIYLSVWCLDENFNVLSGGNRYPYAPIMAVGSEYSYGRIMTGEGGGAGTPHLFAVGTKYIRIGILWHYVGGNGTQVIRALNFEDVTESEAAAASATASAASSSAAAASQTAAGQSAASASTAANTATTQAGAASASATSAASSAGTATTKANEASVSAAVSASTADQTLAANSLSVWRERDAWTHSGSSPWPAHSHANLKSDPGGLLFDGYAGAAVSRQAVAIDPSRKYEMSITASQLSAPTTGGRAFYLRLFCYNQAGAHIGHTSVRYAATIAAGGQTLTGIITGSAAANGSSLKFLNGTVAVRPYLLANYNGGNGRLLVTDCYFRDVTESEAASDSASAAASSASTAAASQTAAGQSAASATAAANTATTQAGAASASATSSAASASTASGHAIAASNSATVALELSNLAVSKSVDPHLVRGLESLTQTYGGVNPSAAVASSSLIESDSTDVNGGKMIRANGYKLLLSRAAFAVDVTRKYKIRARVYVGARVASPSSLYVGFTGLNASYTYLYNRYAAASNITPGLGSWQEYEAVVSGVSASNFTSATKYVRPLVLLNYNSSNTGNISYLSALSIEDITEADDLTTAAVAVESSVRASEIGGIEAKYAVKVGVGGHVSGFGLISTANNAAPTSEFAVLADRFTIARPDGTGSPKQTFTLGEVDGTPTVVLAGDMLADGTVYANAIHATAINKVQNPAKFRAGQTALGWSGGTNYTNSTVFGGARSLYVPSNGNTQILSDRFKVDPTKTYRVTFQVYSTGGNGTRFFGLYAFDANDTTIGVQAKTKTSTAYSAATTNPYFWLKSGTNTPTVKGTAYIIGADVEHDDADVPEGVAQNSFRLPGNADEVRLRFLNYYNAGVSTNAWLSHVTVTEVDAGTITGKRIIGGSIEGDKVKANTLDAGHINVNELAALATNTGSLTISGNAQSANYGPNSGYQLRPDGTATFNGVVLSRQLQVATGSFDIGNQTLNSGGTPTQHGRWFVEDTGVTLTAWAGAQETYIAVAGFGSGTTVNASPSKVPDVLWGFHTMILPLTRWSGPQTLRLAIDLWSKNVQNITGAGSKPTCVWRIFKVT